jgi:hypothetical protein
MRIEYDTAKNVWNIREVAHYESQAKTRFDR